MTATEMFLQYVVPILVSLVVSGVLWLLFQGGKLLAVRAKESKFFAVAAQVAHLAEIVVAEVDAVVRPKLVAALADGKVTQAEAEELKKVALAKLKELLAQRGMKELKGVIGIFMPSVDTYLSGAIEKAVASKRATANP